MSAKDPSDSRLDHLVVVMFENRSFDNLLGALYAPGEVPTFEGVLGKDLSNPGPPGDGAPGRGVVGLHPSPSLAAPYPDPGEEFPHINTQLYNSVDPESNRRASVREMRPPFNSPPSPVAQTPSMAGFANDYASSFQGQMGRPPSDAELAQIMSYFVPSQVPVLSALARGFACFDHWFCEVPSQTYPNRSFFHAASSSGFVLNGEPAGKFALKNDAPTVFEQLEKAGRSWKVYIDPAQILPATALIHARRLAPYFATHFRTIYDFYADVAAGVLPNYAFIEPNMFHPHTDMHPHSGARWAEALRLRPPDTLIGGESLLADIYSSIRTSATPDGSNWNNTALLVTFDEHGGTYDHVPPPAAIPPTPGAGEMGFAFDRLGVRIPTILVSAWCDARVVVTEPYQSTSVIRTLRDWWDLDRPLTNRDAAAPSFLSALNRASPRPTSEWPAASPRAMGVLERAENEFLRAVEAMESPLMALERDMLGEALACEAQSRGTAGSLPDVDQITHPEAHAHFRRIGSAMFPGVANGRVR